jgi:hypothetical protein
MILDPAMENGTKRADAAIATVWILLAITALLLSLHRNGNKLPIGRARLTSYP